MRRSRWRRPGTPAMRSCWCPSRKSSDVVQDVTRDEIIPNREEINRRQRFAGGRVFRCLVPEIPIGGEQRETDGGEIFFDLKQTDGGGQHQVLQRRPPQ